MKKSRQILLMLDWYDYRIHTGIIKYSKEKNWDLFCLNKVSGQDLSMIPGEVLPDFWKIDGAIALITKNRTVKFFKQHKIPTVNLGERVIDLDFPKLLTDNEAIGEIAAEHFLERGFTNFYVPQHRDVPVYLERYRYFREYLRLNGGHECQFIAPEGVRYAVYESGIEYVKRNSHEILKEKLKHLKFPAALFAYEDNLASEWLLLAKNTGIKVPDELAILGADNNPLIVEAFDTSLSSIETDQEGLGYAAAKLLSDILDGKEKRERKTFLHDPISVVTRRSTDTIASKNPMVSQALALIHEDLTINASLLADKLGITQQGLQQAFRYHFHLSPAETIRHLRVREIKHLLADKNIALNTIAKSIGFSSKISFSQFFKRETGMTPGQYRKSHK